MSMTFPTLHGNHLMISIPRSLLSYKMTWAEAVRIGPTLVMAAKAEGRIGTRPDAKEVHFSPLSDEYLRRKKIYNREYNRRRREEFAAKGLTTNGTPRLRSYRKARK